jgi:hypothetical protein
MVGPVFLLGSLLREVCTTGNEGFLTGLFSPKPFKTFIESIVLVSHQIEKCRALRDRFMMLSFRFAHSM